MYNLCDCTNVQKKPHSCTTMKAAAEANHARNKNSFQAQFPEKSNGDNKVKKILFKIKPRTLFFRALSNILRVLDAGEPMYKA